jgi:hypothetical protein
MVCSANRMYVFLLTCSIFSIPHLYGFLEINKKIITISWESLIEHTHFHACRMVRPAATWMNFMHWTFVIVYSAYTYAVFLQCL